MKESKELKVTDLRIGDTVRIKGAKGECTVTGIFWRLGNDLTDATLSLDFEENMGDAWQVNLDEVEKVGGK